MSRTRVVRIVGPIPPPVHGAARVTDLVRLEVGTRPGVRLSVTDVDAAGGVVRRVLVLLRGLAGVLLGRRGSVYVGGAGGELLWYQAIVVAAARVRRHRTVFHHHSFRYLDRDVAAMRLLARVGGAPLTHVVLDASMGERLTGRYPAARRVLVCSNAGLLDAPPEGSAGAGADVPPLVLGHLSNLSVEKGLDVVVDLFTRLRADGRDVRLVLAGPAATPEAEAILDEVQRDCPDDVQVLGRVEPHDVDRFYDAIDLFVFPSTYVHEAEPLVVLEAMRCGVDSVAFAVGCLPALVPPSLLVDRDEDLVAQLLPVLRDRPVPSAADRDRTARRFAARRDASLTAHRALTDALVSPA